MRWFVFALVGLASCSLLVDFAAEQHVCGEDRGCAEAYSCLGEYCVADGAQGEGEACNRQRQCDGALVCADFVCRARCSVIYGLDDDCAEGSVCAPANLVGSESGGACVPADAVCTQGGACLPSTAGAARVCRSLDGGVQRCVEACAYSCTGSGCSHACGDSDDGLAQVCQPILANDQHLCVPAGQRQHHTGCDFAGALCADGNICVRQTGEGGGYCLRLCDPLDPDGCLGAVGWDSNPTSCQKLDPDDAFGVCGGLPP